jgi:hypothetical protein
MWHNRSIEQIEIINTQAEDELRETWDDFIHTHHYGTMADFYASWMAHHPRRTCDAMWAQNMDVRYVDDHPIPRELDFEKLWEWYRPLIEVERAHPAKERKEPPL